MLLHRFSQLQGDGKTCSRRNLVPSFRPQARVAVLQAPHIAARRSLRHFELAQWRRLARFPHEVLAGGLDTLLPLTGLDSLPRPAHAVIVFTRLGSSRLDESARRWLWNTFEVPVFEQLEWVDGSLLAEECEAHSGLHLRASDIPAGDPALRAASDEWLVEKSTLCGCGEVVSRLVPRRLTVRSRAMSAGA